jgi:hypothetical protein
MDHVGTRARERKIAISWYAETLGFAVTKLCTILLDLYPYVWKTVLAQRSETKWNLIAVGT